MRGYPNFNFPAFYFAAKVLRDKGFEVFSPAERDNERSGTDVGAANPDGDIEKACQAGFSLREALRDDTHYICMEADGIALLPRWENSSGARAERALAEALGLKVIVLSEEYPDAVR